MTAAKKLSVDADNVFARFVRIILQRVRIVGAGPFLVVALSGAILCVGFFSCLDEDAARPDWIRDFKSRERE